MILSCDLIILDLHTGDLDDFEELFKALKHSPGTLPKTVILISSLFTWGDTPQKTKISEEGVSIIEESRLEHSQDAINPEMQSKRIKKQFVPFDESEFQQRKSYPKYETWKYIENVCLACNTIENISAYVLAAGIMYGIGELCLSHHFMSGWLGEVDTLPYIAPGDNVIPSVHVRDLGRMVSYIYKHSPSTSYIVGCDHSSDSQLSIVQAISSAMADGRIEAVSFPSVMLEPWSEMLSLHLLITPSYIFEDPAHPLEWHSKKGIVANIDLLNQEFNLYRGLRSVKVFVTGPPVSGKSHYSRKLSEYYSVPHLHVGSLIQEILQSPTELGERIRKKLVDLKQHMIDEAESKKKKNQEIDYSKFNPRVPEDLVAEIVRWKLNSNICRNRGYILDGWPKKYDDAKRLFTLEDESLDTDICPGSIIHLKATNEFLTIRAKSMPEQLVAGTHYNDEGMKRRLQAYRDASVPDKQSLPMQEFFISHKIDMHDIDSSLEEAVNLENIMKYIERSGKPFRYAVQDEPKIQEDFFKYDSLKNLREDDSKKVDQGQNVEYLIMMEQIRAKENNLLELRSQPVRNYLMEKIAPYITEGLFALCEKKPADAILFLSDFLRMKSQNK